jgi:hypothetical protein
VAQIHDVDDLGGGAWYELTENKRLLDAGERAADYLAFYQSVWQPQFMITASTGNGFSQGTYLEIDNQLSRLRVSLRLTPKAFYRDAVNTNGGILAEIDVHAAQHPQNLGCCSKRAAFSPVRAWAKANCGIPS